MRQIQKQAAMASNSRNESVRKQCESGTCGTPDLALSFCASCDSFYCSACWVLQGPHRPGKTGLDGFPHEKTDQDVVKNLKAILEPPSSPETLRKLHRLDAATTWFGVVRSESIHPVSGKPLAEFKDFGRYATLMAESAPQNGAARYPQLVSFIGQTNAGKSTLVKMLISHEAGKMGAPASDFSSPVVGAARDDKLPTSGDVHLYADPATLNTQLPVLYADCEGLDGGEEEPLAAQSRNQPDSEGAIKSVIGGAKRILEWANNDPEASGREYAVKHLYPRLLYTFSDVIVFVLRNAKTFESIALKLLLDWAAASVEKSLNQPVLPHAIVVLNATDLQVHPDEWDVDKATHNLLAGLRNAITNVPVFRRYAEIWRGKGKEINSMEDLIKCFYSSIRVVRIPAKGRYMLIDGQIDKLHDQIMLSCDEAFYTKERARMLSHVDELNEYLQAGFKHFSKRLDVPFNFVEIAVRNNPVPQNYGDHVSNLAAKMQRREDYSDAVYIFEKLSPFVASCLLLEIVRGRRPGSVLDLFDKYYSNMCKGALDRFCDMFWPCSYRDSLGRACRNVKSTHFAKGHQDKDGKIIGPASSRSYESSFSSTAYQNIWIELIKTNLASCQQRLEQKRHTSQFKNLEAQDAFQLHLQDQLKDFFLERASQYFSMATCYCCLMNVPQHPLPCGHVLCTACVKSYGEPLKYSSVRIDSCPLHPDETRNLPPWVIRFKPDFAGVRVLSLDGGGMRGIIELEVLKAIERCIGGKIPVQRFFDLIVGTSTGGIIALGIGAKHWSVDASIRKFIDLCDRAFTPRELHDVHGLRTIVTLRHGSKYKTTPLHSALYTVFGKQYLFGGMQGSDMAYMTKVAVATTSGTGQTPIIITNYGREDEPQLPYRIEFSRGSYLGLKVWEAACATSAAPSYFKPFKHPVTERTYMDGALYYNNPIRIADHERKLLWPDVADNHPDIILSIGTGQNLEETRIGLELGTKSRSDHEKRKVAQNYGKLDNRQKKKLKSHRLQIFNTAKNVKNIFSVLVSRMDTILDSELAWRDFFGSLQGQDSPESSSQRYIRLNPDLKSEVPRLDAKDKLRELQGRVVQELESPSNQLMIMVVAQKLIASSFYFEKIAPKENGINEGYTCSGVINCRFEDGSPELRELGRCLKMKQTPDFQPYFVIEDEQNVSLNKKIPLSPPSIKAMIDRAIFDLGRHDFGISSRLSSTRISICLSKPSVYDSNYYSISGFPRTLVTEDSLKEARLERQRTKAKTRRPGIRSALTDPGETDPAPDDSGEPQQHSVSDSIIPTLRQRIDSMQLELTRSIAPLRNIPSLLDDDEKKPIFQREKASTFPVLTPTRPSPELDRSETPSGLPPTPSSSSSSSSSWGKGKYPTH